MAKLSPGPAYYAVKTSRGPSSSFFHFYSTNYSRHHGNCQPADDLLNGCVAGRTRGTGYVTNFRPTLYYSSSLDTKDNPHMISLLADNYTSLTAQHYRGHSNEACLAAYLQTPTTGQEYVRNPRATKEPPSSDSNGLSGLGKSETQSSFIHKPFQGKDLQGSSHTSVPTTQPDLQGSSHTSVPTTQPDLQGSSHTSVPTTQPDLQGSSHTRREDTGFTHAQNIEPVTFRPSEAFANDLSPQSTWRPTGSSMMKEDFTRPSPTTGHEGCPLVSGRADRSNGYVKGSNYPSSVQPKANEMVGYTLASRLHPTSLATILRQDPAHYSTITQPHHFSSYTHYTLKAGYRGGMERERRPVGERRQLTGYSENNQPLVTPGDRDSGRFSTHYSDQFPQPPLHTAGGVVSRPVAPNGFSRGTQVHGFEDYPVSSACTLRSMHPSQARLVLYRDPCYDDHTHNNKHTPKP